MGVYVYLTLIYKTNNGLYEWDRVDLIVSALYKVLMFLFVCRTSNKNFILLKDIS